MNTKLPSEEESLEKALEQACGLVFDCDGTLIDTMPIYYISWELTCKDVGLDNFPIERFYENAGRPVDVIFQMLIDEKQKEQGKEWPNHITATYCENMKKAHHAKLEKEGKVAGPIDVVVDIVKRFHGKIPMAVASSGWRDHVLKGLERVGILHLFDAVVTADQPEVERPKPHPDMFLVAAKKIGVPPSKCIGFEDADLGMQAIKSAGFSYASDVRLLHMYPRNVEKRMVRQVTPEM